MRKQSGSLLKISLAVLVVFGFSLVSAGGALARNDECKQDKGMPKPYNFYFDVNSTALSQADRDRLKEISSRAKYRVVVCVVGQADKQGSLDYNKKLALKRAQAVAALMIQDGVPKDTIITRAIIGEAFGDSALFEWMAPHNKDRQVNVIFVH